MASPSNERWRSRRIRLTGKPGQRNNGPTRRFPPAFCTQVPPPHAPSPSFLYPFPFSSLLSGPFRASSTPPFAHVPSPFHLLSFVLPYSPTPSHSLLLASVSPGLQICARTSVTMATTVLGKPGYKAGHGEEAVQYCRSWEQRGGALAQIGIGSVQEWINLSWAWGITSPECTPKCCYGFPFGCKTEASLSSSICLDTPGFFHIS